MLARLALVLLLACAAVRAEKPALEHLFPAGMQPGSTQAVTLFGKFESWPPRAWSSSPALSFNFGTNKGSLKIAAKADASPGACFIRLYNGDGASDPVLFVIDKSPQMAEAEPNNHFRHPQAITNVPVTINGRLEKNGDVDSFAFDLKAGEWLDAAADSYTLMSKVDCVLRLLDAEGYQLAWNHDFGSLDPRLTWRSPRDQRVVLQIFGFPYPANSEIVLSGGPGGEYRLRLNRGAQEPRDLCFALAEHEPNNHATNAAALSLPGEVTGAICPARDEDRFAVKLHKDEFIEAAVEAAAIGSPLDAWLRIEDAAGKELARSDDADNSRDPRLDWKAPGDATYYIALGSVTHQTGQEYRYRLGVRPLKPDYHASVAANAFAFTPGSTNEIKFTLKRLRGFTRTLTAGFSGLPESASVLESEIPSGDGEAVMKLLVRSNAPAFSGPIQIQLADADGSKRAVPFELVSRTENNGVPGGYSKLLLESLDQLWLTILPAPKAK